MATSANQRINIITSHLLSTTEASPSLTQHTPIAKKFDKSPDDIVIVRSVRTAVGKAKRGSFKDTSPDNLLAPILKNLIETTKIDPKLIGDVVIGTVLPKGALGATEVRIACLLAGLPKEVPCTTVNRQCSSGLQALANVAGAIKAGYYDIGIAGGVESMSKNGMDFEGELNEAALAHDLAKNCYNTMGQTSENVAERYNISRKKQDEFAALSYARAVTAIKTGKFKEEIVPITVKITDQKTGESKEVVVDTDEGPRPTTFEQLSKLKPSFQENGTTTAGNASQLSDGAAAMIVTKRSVAQKLRLPIFATFRSFAAVGVAPEVMGIGPAYAIPACLERVGLTINDVDVFEINEAFASQCTFCVDHLKLDMNKVNPNGGAIALGHPLGMTGARMTATLLHELKRRKGRYGIVSMCIGSGMGAAGLFELEL